MLHKINTNSHKMNYIRIQKFVDEQITFAFRFLFNEFENFCTIVNIIRTRTMQI